MHKSAFQIVGDLSTLTGPWPRGLGRAAGGGEIAGSNPAGPT